MVNDRLIPNAHDLEQELNWFGEFIKLRMAQYFGQDTEKTVPGSLLPPAFSSESSMYAAFIHHYQLTPEERLLLVLSLVPHIRPELLDIFFSANKNFDRGFTEFGGIHGKNHGGFIPTAETFLFLAAGRDLKKRFQLNKLFDSDHFFAKHDILKLEPPPDGEPISSGTLRISAEFVDLFTAGVARKPDLSINFPAKQLHTELEWADLILDESTLIQLDEIKAWIRHSHTLLYDWGMKKHMKKGYRALFHGPSGTGKSLTATLLGKYTGHDVYRIDLSLIVSKYIGETEKNLSKIFDRAEHKNWILFFDEADALFGKRTEVHDAHDRYANQEVSYLLQRIEEHDGIVILASNLKSNLDDSFTRRFDSIIYFPMPSPGERLKLWKQGFSDKTTLADDIDLEETARQYEISGGAIMNIIRYSSLMALKRNSTGIIRNELIEGIRKEYQKEGRTL